MNRSKQFGQIGATAIAIIALVGIVAILFFSYVASHNRGNAFEADLRKSHAAMETTLSSCTTDIRNISKIPDQYAEQLKDVIKAEMDGRYGGQGTDRVAKFVSERGINFDSSMLQKVQNRVSACETQFKNAQDRMADTREEYNKALGSFWGGQFMSLAGYPKMDLDKFKVIMDESSARQFETGKREDYDLNIKK